MSAHAARADRGIALLLGIAFVLVYLFFAHGHFAGSDEIGVFEITASLYEDRDLTVPLGVHVLEGQGGRLYNHFGVGQAVLALPLYAAGALAERVLPAPWVEELAGQRLVGPHGLFGGTPKIFAVTLYAPLASGVLVGLFFLFERRLGASLGSALAAAALLGGTTYVAMMSIYFLQHTTEALLVLGALYGFRAWREGGRLAALAAGSVSASYLILVRVAGAAAAPGLAGYLLHALAVRRRRDAATAAALVPALAAIAIPFAAAVAAYVAVNQARWGAWLWSPALGESQHFGQALYYGLYGFLLSPGCGIFWYSPLLLLVPWTLPPFWRSHRPECAAVLAVVACFLLMCARYRFWTGLWSCPGPRYLFIATPLLMLPLGPWLDARRDLPARVAVGVLALAGAAVQLVLCGTRWATVAQTENYLRWQPDMQFVFVPDLSPIVGSARTLAARGLDTWLWNLGRGWEGHPGAPGAAAAVGALWALSLAACLVALARAVRRAPGARG